MKRQILPSILKDLNEKMVFLAGPRQVGKTTFSLELLGTVSTEHPAYINWDYPPSRTSLLKGEIPADQNFLVFDEIHKYHDWRNLIKGIYDRYKSSRKFLITGSARLDYYRRGGDSLQGRYHLYRMHPLSLFEITSTPNDSDLEYLLRTGGFPEPFFKAEEIFWKRWQLERQKRIIQEDLIQLEKVREISKLELLHTLLLDRVGSILSVNSLREDLSVSHETVENYLQIFENLYSIYRISPYYTNKVRSVKKEKKLYFWDWSLCKDSGARFENFIGSQLLKYCHFREDVFGFKMELQYLRDTDKREIDFVVIEDDQIKFAVECKLGEKQISKHISYFSERVGIPKIFQIHLGKEDFEKVEIRTRVMPALRFLEMLEKSLV